MAGPDAGLPWDGGVGGRNWRGTDRAALAGPWAVLMTTDTGEREEVFPSLFQAELFLSYIPLAAVISEEFAAVRSAILSPLVGAGKGERPAQGVN